MPSPAAASSEIAVLVVGAGGHAAEVCSYLADAREAGARLRLLGCVDDHKPVGRCGPVEVIGDFSTLERLARAESQLRCLIAIGDNPTRRRIAERIDAVGVPDIWLTLRHPSAYVGQDVSLGPGTCLAPGSIVTARVRVGAHVIVNVNASVSHDAVVGDFVNLNPGSAVAGHTRLGDGCYIGAGATVIDRVSVGPWAVVGAGAAVVRDLPANVTAVGVPARVIKQR
jgi:sugar O-acyltransferase (sialic acid O-acetyltransferase NeuD family)